MLHIMRRIAETIGITVVSSFPISFLLMMNIVPMNMVTNAIFLGISMVVFMALNVVVLRGSMMKYNNTWWYLAVNVPIWFVLTVASFIVMKKMSVYTYTAFFGFTWVLYGFGVSKMWSAAIFWLVYLLEILYFPGERKIYLLRRKRHYGRMVR